MNKSIYLAVLASLALTACSNDGNDIFDQSAAERLEQYKNDYAEVLTAEGGLWTMEYFSNEEEPGYLFVMKFNKDGSVKIAANHKWINNTYREETSLWTMVADNGPVLSFNSYNPVFHIFSDPANITGPDAPKGDNDDDINETGYGHNGDYEFQVMEVSDDRNMVRLLSKKRLIDIYLHRIDPSTDVKSYLTDYQQMASNLFSKEISKIFYTDDKGEKYIVSNGYTGILSIYPMEGDAVDQTRSGNFIITPSGIRFMNPLEYVNAAGEEKTVTELKFTGNYSLVDVENENSFLSCGSFTDMTMLNKKNWKVDMKSLDGSMKSAMDALNDQLKTLYNYKSATVNEMSFDYDSASKSYILRLYIRMSAKGYETDKYMMNFSDVDGGVKISIGDAYDNGSQLALNAYTTLQSIFELITSSTIKYTTVSDCGPKTITFEVNGGSMTINAI